jgi:hypothetical protein
VSQQDLKLLGTRLAAEDSVNLFYAQIRVNKMVGLSHFRKKP